MASTSGNHVICLLHTGGRFINGEEGEMQYVGGSTISRTIKEGTTYEELRRIVASVVREDNRGITMKFRVCFDDTTTYVDLVDDEGVEHFMNFNRAIGHIYVCGCVDENSQLTRDDGRNDEIALDSLAGSCDGVRMSQMILVNEDSQSLSCAIQMMPTPRAEMNSTKWRDLIIGVGKIFVNADDARQTLYKYSVAHKFAYQFLKNNKQKIIAKCMVEKCPWYMGAYELSKGAEFLVVRKFVDEHKHNAQDNLVVPHSTRTKLTASIMVDSLRDNIDKSAGEIRKDMYREYGLRLNYSQAYWGKARALNELQGSANDSYKLIPWICERLNESDPDTVARWEESEDDRFKRLFIAYGCSIKGFLAGCRHVLYIDGCHLSGPYKGTLLSACAYDADNEMFPLAYAIVSGETTDDWGWFLENIKGITRETEITIVSDRNAAIISAVSDVFGSERHAYCYRHVKENFSSEYVKINRGKTRIKGQKKEDALKLLDAIAYARHGHDFAVAMEKLRMFSPELAEWVETQGDVEKWALSKFGFKRWDNITTNLAESFNAWILQERKHNVCTFIHEHREKLAMKMVASKQAMTNWENGVGPNTNEKLMETVSNATNMEVKFYGGTWYEVHILVDHRLVRLVVDIGKHECTCLAWQMSGLPCVHACAAIKLHHGNVCMFVDDFFKQTTQAKIYENNMTPIATHDCPCPSNLNETQLMTGKFLKPPMTKRPAGRPKRKRIESQFQNKHVYHCGRCHEAGHTAKTCKNPNPS